MNSQTTDRFALGQIVATPGALELMAKSNTSATPYLRRHIVGDWGDVCPEDWEANQNALETGERLLSSYKLPDGEKLWVITEAEGDDGTRASTCLLLPSEY